MHHTTLKNIYFKLYIFMVQTIDSFIILLLMNFTFYFESIIDINIYSTS